MEHARVEIRPVADAQAPAVMALLPELAHAPALELLAAWQGDRLAGAAGIVWQSGPRFPGFSVWLHVRPEFRRQGIGLRMIESIRTKLAAETDGVWAARLIDVESPEAEFLLASGFEARQRQFNFEMDLAVSAPIAQSIADRLRSGGRIPAGAVAVPLREAPLAEVAALIAAHLGGTQPGLLRALEAAAAGSETTLDLDLSVAVLEDGQLAGVLLGSGTGRKRRVDASVTAPAWRNSYVQALLLAESGRRSLGRIDSVQYVCDEENMFPVKVARRISAAHIVTRAFFYQAVASAA